MSITNASKSGLNTSLLPEGIKKDQATIKRISRIAMAVIGIGTIAAVVVLTPMILAFVGTWLQIALTGLAAVVITVLAAGIGFLAFVFKDAFVDWSERLGRAWWKRFIYSDPIDYLRGMIAKFEEKLDIIAQTVRQLRSVEEKLSLEGDRDMAQARESYHRANALEEGEEQDLEAFIMQNKLQSAEQIQETYLEVRDSRDLLEEVHKGFQFNIKMMSEMVNAMERNLEIQRMKSDAADAMKSIMHGDIDDRARTEIANRAYMDMVSKYSANFKQTIDMAKPLLESQRITKTIATREGKEALKALRANKDFQMSQLKSFRERLEQARLNRDSSGNIFERINRQGAEPLKTKGRLFSGLD